jgi:hypothetical protein
MLRAEHRGPDGLVPATLQPVLRMPAAMPLTVDSSAREIAGSGVLPAS